MSILEFIASLAKSLAWPTVALVAVFVFRSAIASRIGSILKISHGDTAVEFDHAAREVEAAIATDRLPGPTRHLIETKTHLATNVGRIVEAWNRLEDAVRRLLAAAGVDDARMGSAAMLRLAHEHQLITSEQMKSLLGLNTMRNLAVHGRASEIDEARTQEFLVLADAMATVLEISGGDRGG